MLPSLREMTALIWAVLNTIESSDDCISHFVAGQLFLITTRSACVGADGVEGIAHPNNGAGANLKPHHSFLERKPHPVSLPFESGDGI